MGRSAKRENQVFSWLKKASRVLGERLDAVLALIAAFVFGLAGTFGWIANGEHLAAATLLVLSLVGVSLVIERSLRLSSKRELDLLGEEVAKTVAAVTALHGGRPYHVELDVVKLDITAADGSLARLDRTKKLIFEHNNVCSLYDSSHTDGTEDDPRYEPGERADTFNWAGDSFTLVSLGRFYMRGEKLNFRITRTVRDAFTKRQERTTIETYDPTIRRVMTVTWPEDRPPASVSLLITSAQGERRTQDIADRLESKNDRPALTIEVHQPELGSLHTIEWEW